MPTALPLLCHPATPASLPLSLTASLHVHDDGCELVYQLQGRTDALRVPAPVPPGPADGLWQHTCFEAFFAVESEAAYLEFNFAPSGQWAAYRFSAERQRDDTPAHALPAPRLHVEHGEQALCLRAHLPWGALPRKAAAWSVAITAVIEEAEGRLSYWALHHPGARPDFHHRDGRALRVALS